MIMFHEIRPYTRQTLSAISFHCWNPKSNHTQPGCPKATSQLMDHLHHSVRHAIRARALIQIALLCTETLEVHLCHLLADKWLQCLVKNHHRITHSHTRRGLSSLPHPFDPEPIHTRSTPLPATSQLATLPHYWISYST